MTTINGIKANDIARELVMGVMNNTINGRLSGEIIPYYYCSVADDYGIGLGFNYDDKKGLSYNLYVPNEISSIDLDDDDAVNEYTGFLDFVNVVNWLIEGFIGRDYELSDEFYDNVEDYQISQEDADAKTKFLFENKCMMYV